MRSLVVALSAAVIFAGSVPTALGGPMRVETSVTPRWLYFGDTVVARVEVVVDSRAIEAASINVTTAFAPWQELDRTSSSTRRAGRVVRRTWWYTLACLTSPCVPRGTFVQGFRLHALTVSALRADGRKLDVRRAWPKLNVTGRFLPTAISVGAPPFRVPAGLPAATYRADPSTLAVSLDVIGALAICFGIGIAALEARRLGKVRGGAVPARPAYVRALALVHQAEGRNSDDRRRAVGLLARTLPDQSPAVQAASEVAWSMYDPSPDRLQELASEVEAEIEEWS